MNFTNQEILLIKESLNNFIKSIDYTDNQDYIDENKNNYIFAKKLVLKLDTEIQFSDDDLKLFKICLREYIFDLDEDKYEIETKLNYISKKIILIKNIENKI